MQDWQRRIDKLGLGEVLSRKSDKLEFGDRRKFEKKKSWQEMSRNDVGRMALIRVTDNGIEMSSRRRKKRKRRLPREIEIHDKSNEHTMSNLDKCDKMKI